MANARAQIKAEIDRFIKREEEEVGAQAWPARSERKSTEDEAFSPASPVLDETVS
jgi:hypothetical protein